VLQLALGYNGLGRLDGNETGSVGFGGGTGPRFAGSAGLTRLFAGDMGGQVSWLLPAALSALAAMAWVSGRAARTDRLRAAALLWGGWLLVTGGVFSFMAGIIHPYYTVALVPPIGALTGIGAVLLWRGRDRLWARLTLAGAIVVTAPGDTCCWTGRLGWLPWLRAVVVVTGALAAALVLAAPALARRQPVPLPAGPAAGRWPSWPSRLALISALAGPTATASTPPRPPTPALPAATRPGLVRRPRRWRPGRDRSRRRANTGVAPPAGGWAPRAGPRPVPRQHGRDAAHRRDRSAGPPRARSQAGGPGGLGGDTRWRPP
jgi:4-amino-4-deoxy-L-arabinose transferase-like glycosyltransferase